ncbi:unnamed protein product [Prunus armeniaca]
MISTRDKRARKGTSSAQMQSGQDVGGTNLGKAQDKISPFSCLRSGDVNADARLVSALLSPNR